MPLSIDRLRVFVEVAHAGSIAAAAKRMRFTASALSQQLAKLEREVGDHLLDRGPTGASLTPAGRTLLEHAERVLGAMHDAEAAMAGQAPPERLSVGTFASAGLALVPLALATFRNRHPSVRLSLLDIEPPGGYGLVTAGELDLLITHRYPGVALPPATGLQRTHLLTDPLRLVLPPDHRRAGARRIGLATLAGEDWISGGSGVPNRVALEQAAQRAGIEPRVAYETRDYAVTLALVAAGLGVALVPETALRATGPGSVVVRDLAQPVARDIFLVHRPRPRPAVHDMVGLLRPPPIA